MRHGLRRDLAAAALFTLGFALVYGVLILTPWGQRLDAQSFGDVAALTAVFGSSAELSRTLGALLLAVGAGVAIVDALRRRRFAAVLRVGVLAAVALPLAQLLKLVLHRPLLGDNAYVENTFPSGHVALALVAVLAIATLAPAAAWRTAVVVVAVAVAIGVGWASLVSLAHRPSDLTGAAFLVGAVASLAFAGSPPALVSRPVCAAVASVGLASGVVLAAAGGAGTALGAWWGAAVSTAGWFTACAVPVLAVTALAPIESSGDGAGRSGV